MLVAELPWELQTRKVLRKGWEWSMYEPGQGVEL